MFSISFSVFFSSFVIRSLRLVPSAKRKHKTQHKSRYFSGGRKIFSFTSHHTRLAGNFIEQNNNLFGSFSMQIWPRIIDVSDVSCIPSFWILTSHIYPFEENRSIHWSGPACKNIEVFHVRCFSLEIRRYILPPVFWIWRERSQAGEDTVWPSFAWLQWRFFVFRMTWLQMLLNASLKTSSNVIHKYRRHQILSPKKITEITSSLASPII